MAGAKDTSSGAPHNGSTFTRYLVATNNDAERAYFSGYFRVGHGAWNSFEPVMVAEPERAWALPALDAAQRVACGLTELSSVMPPCDARTFYAFEAPETVSQIAARIKDAVRS